MDSEYARFLKTLSNEKRFDIIQFLSKGPRNVTEIEVELNLKQSITSSHLATLLKCGFVSVKRSGKERVYSLNGTITPLLRVIDKHTKKYCVNCES